MTYEEAGVRFCAVSACGGRGTNENTGLNPELLRQKVASYFLAQNLFELKNGLLAGITRTQKKRRARRRQSAGLSKR
jgi:hypothetical protein